MGRGRPLGWRKEEGVRTLHTVKAYDDEWELIKRFAKLLKHGDKELCKAALEKLEHDSTQVE